MKENLEDRCILIARYVVENKATVRNAAKEWGVSKSTVHNDLAYRLKNINKDLYTQVRDILAFNKSQRHIRGGKATKMKWQHQHEQ